MHEEKGFSLNGYSMLLVLFAAIGLLLTIIVEQIMSEQVNFWFFVPLVSIVFILPGFLMVQPNQGKVMTLFGSYVGTIKANGLRWTFPFFIRKTISLRIRNF